MSATVLRWASEVFILQDNGEVFISNRRVEGVYCRIMDDKNEWLEGRAKIVRTDFLAGNEHCTRGYIRPNQYLIMSALW